MWVAQAVFMIITILLGGFVVGAMGSTLDSPGSIDMAIVGAVVGLFVGGNLGAFVLRIVVGKPPED
jgi:hypothetical protein